MCSAIFQWDLRSLKVFACGWPIFFLSCQQLGPHHQSSSSFSWEVSTPLEPRSAGFFKVKQYAHFSLFVSLRISSTLCHTNRFHLPLFWIQLSAVLLSIQNLTPSTFTCDCNALHTVFISCANILTDINSKHGMESCFKGVTLISLATKLAWAWKRISMLTITGPISPKGSNKLANRLKTLHLVGSRSFSFSAVCARLIMFSDIRIWMKCWRLKSEKMFFNFHIEKCFAKFLPHLGR